MQRPRSHAAKGWIYEIAILEIVSEPKKETIELCPWLPSPRRPTALHEAERWWIAYGRASGWPLRNKSDGGEGGRHLTPFDGRVTLAKAAEISGLSYPEVHRRATAGTAPAEQADTGTWTMAEADASQLARRPPAEVKRVANLRASPERWAAWKREAKRRGMSVSQLAGKLADEASGWSGSATANDKRKP